VKVITLVLEDSNQQPATVTTATQWRTAHKLYDETVCADPGWVFHDGNNGLPMNIIVNPRTMRIISIISNPAFYSLDDLKTNIAALVAQNKQ
jgi:hypothetical protein